MKIIKNVVLVNIVPASGLLYQMYVKIVRIILNMKKERKMSNKKVKIEKAGCQFFRKECPICGCVYVYHTSELSVDDKCNVIIHCPNCNIANLLAASFYEYITDEEEVAKLEEEFRLEEKESNQETSDVLCSTCIYGDGPPSRICDDMCYKYSFYKPRR